VCQAVIRYGKFVDIDHRFPISTSFIRTSAPSLACLVVT